MSIDSILCVELGKIWIQNLILFFDDYICLHNKIVFFQLKILFAWFIKPIVTKIQFLSMPMRDKN